MNEFYRLSLTCIYIFALFDKNFGDISSNQNFSLPVNNHKFILNSTNDLERSEKQIPNVDIIGNGFPFIQSHMSRSIGFTNDSVISTPYVLAFALNETEFNLTQSKSEIGINEQNVIIINNGTNSSLILFNDVNSTSDYFLNISSSFNESSELISKYKDFDNCTTNCTNANVSTNSDIDHRIFNITAVAANTVQTITEDNRNQMEEFLNVTCPIYVPKLLTHKVDIVFSLLEINLEQHKLLKLFETKLRQALQEKNCYFITPLAFNHGSHFTYRWTNSSLNFTCDTNIIKHKIFNESSLSSTFKKAFLPYFNIESVLIFEAGICTPRNINTTVIIVVLVIAAVISAFCSFGIYRCISQKKKKHEKMQKRILKPRFPIILDTDNSPPSYVLKKIESSYHIANPSFEEET